MPAKKSATGSDFSVLRRVPAWACAVGGIAAVAAVALVVAAEATGAAAQVPAKAGLASAALAVAPTAATAGPAASTTRPDAFHAATAAAAPTAATPPAAASIIRTTTVAAAARFHLSAYEMAADFVPASAAGSTDQAPFGRIFLADISNGQAAIDALGEHLPAVAAWYGKSSTGLIALLLSDHTVHVDRRGRLLHIDAGLAVARAEAPGDHPAYAGAPLPAGTDGADVVSGNVPATAGAPFPADQTFPGVLLPEQPGQCRIADGRMPVA